MHASNLLIAAVVSLAPALVAAAPQANMPGTASNCDKLYKVVSGDTCEKVVTKNNLSLSQFMSWNTGVNTQCTNLALDANVCVHVPGAATPSSGGSWPQPQMPGLVASCNTMVRVNAGDSCNSVSKAHGISLQQFMKWNTALDSRCSNLWLGYNVCVGGN